MFFQKGKVIRTCFHWFNFWIFLKAIWTVITIMIKMVGEAYLTEDYWATFAFLRISRWIRALVACYQKCLLYACSFIRKKVIWSMLFANSLVCIKITKMGWSIFTKQRIVAALAKLNCLILIFPKLAIHNLMLLDVFIFSIQNLFASLFKIFTFETQTFNNF